MIESNIAIGNQIFRFNRHSIAIETESIPTESVSVGDWISAIEDWKVRLRLKACHPSVSFARDSFAFRIVLLWFIMFLQQFAVLHCFAICCNVLHQFAMFCNALPCRPPVCQVLHRLQFLPRVAMFYIVLLRFATVFAMICQGPTCPAKFHIVLW